MFEFKPIASGSSGNCHLIKTDNISGLIDIGIPWKRVQEATEFTTSSLDFVLVTHRHLDHSGYIKEAIRAGIDVYAIQDVWNSNNISSHRIHTITPMKQFQIKNLTILPFSVPHDVENVGFLIADDRGNKMLYLTDCFYSPFRFKNLNLIAVECNYSLDILNRNMDAGAVPKELKSRILKSHFSLENVKEFLKANDLSRVREIWLLHLSDGNSDSERFKREIQELTGKMVFVA
ncbi:MBL fold metallo-hydrolase [Acetivibrio straminisolvens]|uniref:MBL fold metallo-hydrolase n=1 Tax=Acetivibrio straminisolvens TaxID=253314 RepID=UPI002240863A|nr:MBL fold metallo-hydrolase [Acetivibrio straminisolvens]